MNIHQEMEAFYRVRNGEKQEAARRGVKIDGHFVARSTGSNVLYCPSCSAPVVDSMEGRQAHRERMPECKRKP